jgi:hypothetical protein
MMIVRFIGIAGCSLAIAQLPGTFSTTGNMTTQRMFHTATLLTNGKVLIAGGFALGSGWPVWASAELYDPLSGSFSASSSMTTPRHDHSATLLPDGRILIAGGESQADPAYGSGKFAVASAELYDPATGKFTPTGFHDYGPALAYGDIARQWQGPGRRGP